jgi:hypothetical protein
MSKPYQQGRYIPKNPSKYIGDITKIRYMSSWEYEMHKFLDNNPYVIEWASEEIAIPYIKPTDNKVHKYYVDYYIKYVDKNGNIKTELIEIKPTTQTKASRSKKTITQLKENITFAINVAKWKAAQDFAYKNGWTFRIITENEIFK